MRVQVLYGAPHDNYRNYLRHVLAERSQRNSSYSLRAFANSLRVAPSTLSWILSGQRGLSMERAGQVAACLDLNDTEREYFYVLVQMDSVKDPVLKESALRRAQQINPQMKVHNLSVDRFKIISDWQHFALLAALDLTNQKPTLENLARNLDRPPIEVQMAMERMERLELVEKDPKGRYRSVQPSGGRGHSQ